MLIYINRLYKCFCLSSPISNKGIEMESQRTAIEDQLRRRGYKLTKQREAIIKYWTVWKKTWQQLSIF